MQDRTPATRSPHLVRRRRLARLPRPPRRNAPHHPLHRKQPNSFQAPDPELAVHHPLRRLAPPRRPQPQFALRGPAAGRRPVLMSVPLAIHDFTPGGLNAAQEFLKRTRWELRTLRRVRVWKDCLEVFDVNGDSFVVRDIGYVDADIAPLLR